MVGGIHQLVRDVSEELTVAVCPLSVLRTWYDTLQDWTTFGDRIVMADHQSKITAHVMRHARVLITTPEILIQAFKTFMWRNPRAERHTTKTGKTVYRSGFCRGINPTDKKKKARFGDKLPPIHPLFKHMENRSNYGKHAFTTVIVDEVHKCSNPLTWSGHVIGKLCKEAVYTVGLTGTPVRAKPKQVAWICKTLNIIDSEGNDWLQDARYYTVRGGGESCIRRSTITHLHNEAVDRVDDTVVDLQPITKVLLDYDPFVGRKRDGSYDADQQKRHNSWINRAHQAAAEAIEGDGYRKHLDTWLWQAFNTMTQFTFDATLGTYGAEAFQKDPQIYYKLSKRQPSQTVRLIWRMLRDRQSKGHPRIVVYSESTVMLTIARNYVSKAGHCGKLFLFTGGLDAQQRDTMIKDFLSDDYPKGVLFMSSAGAIGTNICPGCDTMFVVGDIPWNNSDLQQAHGRVHRISQDKPVEIVQFEPRRSVTSAKLTSHEDKRLRLEPAIMDEDFSNFSMDAEQRWRLRAQMTLGLTTVDERGNYKETQEMIALGQEWKQACEQAAAAGDLPPPQPVEIAFPDPELADDIELPPVSYPVPGFVEPPSDDEEDDLPLPYRGKRSAPLAVGSSAEPVEPDSEDEAAALHEMLAGSKSAGKRPKIRLEAPEDAKARTARRLSELRQLVAVESDDEDSEAEAWIDEEEEEEEEEAEESEWDEAEEAEEEERVNALIEASANETDED